MAAKLLHSLADDNPDLRKQIGCMTGIFNLFDRHNAITTKRISHKRLSPGHSQSNPGDLVGTVHQEKPNESSLNENVNEKQSMPAESSRDSLSSCSSSLSSMECNKTAQLEALSFSRTNIVESPSMGLPLDPLNTYSYPERQPFHIKHVVQDSMHREVRTSFVKMTDVDDFGYDVKHRDSPRPPPMSKCAEVSSRVARNHKQDVTIDIEESFRVLAKLKDASWNFNEATRCRTSACETEATHGKNLLSRDLRRLSYDGRERNQSSLESRNPKSSPKLKELPRLSLDSRETSACRNFQNTSCSTDESPDLHHSSGNQKRLPSVVAKLMGLETLPDTFSSADTQYCGETLAKSLESRNLKISASDKSLSKCPTSPRRKNNDLIRKPIQTSRLPVETAPWRKLDGTRVTKSTALRHVKSPGQSSTPAVHGEVEMKLKDLEFEQSSKDLRSLKKILEAIQIRALSEIENKERTSVFGIQRNQEPFSSSPNQKTRLMSQQNRRSSVVVNSSTSSAPNYSEAYESPIIIMRPAKPVEKAVISTSVIQMDRFPVPHKLQNEGFQDNKKGSNNGEIRARVPKSTQKNLAAITPEKKSISRNIRSPQTSSKPQLAPKERNTNSIKSSDSVSPRLRHGKVEVEKRSHPPKSDANKSKRKMKQTDSCSHCGKIKPKSSNIRQCDDQSSEMNNEPGVLSYQSDGMTQRSDTSLSLDSKMDVEVTSSTQSTEIDDSQQATETVELLTPCSVKKLPMVASREDGLTVEQDAIALEHPSPVSVLDGSLYRDDEASPVKKITISLHGDDSLDSIERRSKDQCNNSDDIFVNPLVLNHNVEIDSMNFENIGDLTQKLGHLNSHHDEGEKDYNGLCENTRPDHIYISEILLASGILLRGLGSDLTTFQLHPNGNPIDPELFFILEKTKVGSLPPKEGFSPARASYSNREKFDRKLIFDAVNEILNENLALIDGGSPEPWLKPTKIAKEAFSGKKILKQLCNEIERFQAKKFRCNFDDMKDDSMSILQDDLMRQSWSWTDFQGDVYDVVLDVERSIFKDLVNEIIVW